MAALALVVGCTGDDDAAEPNPAVEDQDQIADDGGDAIDDDDLADDVGEDGDEQTEQDPARLGTVAVDQTITHPMNVEVTVTEVTVERNAVYVGLEAFNGASEDISLAWDEDVFTRLMVDDRLLPYQPPEDDPSLDIPVGGELTARLAFLGRVGTEDDTVDLLLNWADAGPLNLTGETGNSPSFEFRDLPLPDER